MAFFPDDRRVGEEDQTWCPVYWRAYDPTAELAVPRGCFCQVSDVLPSLGLVPSEEFSGCVKQGDSLPTWR